MTNQTDEDILDLDVPSDEPERPPFKFKFGGELFTCRPPEELDVRELPEIIAQANINPAVLLEVMLDDEEIARLESLEAVFDLGMLRRVRERYEAHYGMDAPKASGSRRSSKSKRVR